MPIWCLGLIKYFPWGLTIISRADLAPTSSVLDNVKEKTEDTPSIPENNN